MSTKLQPARHDTELIYKCPNCELEHYKRIAEVQRSNQFIDCTCGTTTEIAQLKEVFLKYKIAKKVQAQPQPRSALSPNEKFDIAARACNTIRAQGFTMTEARGLVKEAMRKHNPTKHAELVRLALQEVETEHEPATTKI